MQTFLDGTFQLLFKYRPEVFAEGELAFGVAGPMGVALAIAAIALGAGMLTYRRVGAASTRRDRIVLAGMRGAALLLVIACLFRPMLLLSSPVPQKNFVAVLVDDSRSMRIAEEGNTARADVARAALAGDSALVDALRERFQVRLFRFGAGLQRIADATALTFDGVESRLADAIGGARQELDAVPLSGLVVLSDGADNASAVVDPELAALRARAVPVFTVGIGEERFERDIEIERLELPRQVLEGTSFLATAVVRHRGFDGVRVPLVVEDDGRVIAREEIELPPDGATAPIRLPVTVTRAGPRTLRFYVPGQPREQVTQNNERHALVDVRRRREKILYVEGEPRYEVRFIRAAVEADSNVQLVVLQRTAENKFLRLNVDGPQELAGGFPTTRAELFRYRAIVLGSIEASAFTPDQLRMLADFVSVRGGGMLFLGGRRAFGEGGYAGTPLADILPMYLDGPAVPDSLTPFVELMVHVTPTGASHPVTQLARRGPAGDTSAITRVPVTSVNRITRLKPGAVTLLEGTSGRERQPVLVYQRYGRGLSVAMPIQDSFLWQMHADVSVDDATHRTLWRQLLRWIASDTPEQLRITTSADRVRPGGAVIVRAELADSSFVRRNDARLTARVTAPSGEMREVPLEWVVDRDGEYRASFASTEPGIHTIRVSAAAGTGPGARALAGIADSTFVQVAELNAEYYGAEMRRPLLERIAEETGGKFYTPATMRTLPDDIALNTRGVTVVSQMDLWDMPAVLLALVALLAGEWAYRRRKGLI